MEEGAGDAVAMERSRSGWRKTLNLAGAGDVGDGLMGRPLADAGAARGFRRR